MFNIQVRDVPGQIVASERAVKRQDELGAWLPGAMSRVAQVAVDCGGFAGTDIQTYPNRGEFAPEPVFIVIYDGNPSDGPMTIEVTAPVIPMDDAAMTSAGRQVRHVPAYREAFVRLARSEAEPSELWRAYEGVEAWVLSHGLEIAAAPREVYFTDFFNAAPDDEVCDIAWPVK